MIDNSRLYKEISLEIIELFKNQKLDDLDCLLENRQEILNQEVNNEIFKESLINDGILDIDKQIYNLLSKSMDKLKKEIREHKKNNIAYIPYFGLSKQNLNIFNKKV